MAINDSAWRSFYEFQNNFLINRETFRIPYTFVQTVLFNCIGWEV